MTSDRLVEWGLALVLSVAPVASAVVSFNAIAEPTTGDRETARGLMTEGDTAFDAKDYKKALQKYVQAHALVDLPSTGIWVVKAHEKLGELIEARESALEVVRIPTKPGEKQAQTDARAEAEALSTSLAKRIPTLLVVVDGVPDGATFELEIDGETIRSELVSVPRKVNPGSHSIRVSSATFATVETSAEVPESGPITFPVHVAATAPRGTEPEKTKPPMVPVPRDRGGAASEGSWWSPVRIGGFVTGGIGLALVGAGTGLLVFAQTTTCVPPLVCDATQPVVAGGVLVGIGGAALVTGIVMVALAPRVTTGTSPHTSVLVVPWADGKTRGVGVIGAF